MRVNFKDRNRRVPALPPRLATPGSRPDWHGGDSARCPTFTAKHSFEETLHFKSWHGKRKRHELLPTEKYRAGGIVPEECLTSASCRKMSYKKCLQAKIRLPYNRRMQFMRKRAWRLGATKHCRAWPASDLQLCHRDSRISFERSGRCVLFH